MKMIINKKRQICLIKIKNQKVKNSLTKNQKIILIKDQRIINRFNRKIKNLINKNYFRNKNTKYLVILNLIILHLNHSFSKSNSLIYKH